MKHRKALSMITLENIVRGWLTRWQSKIVSMMHLTKQKYVSRVFFRKASVTFETLKILQEINCGNIWIRPEIMHET